MDIITSTKGYKNNTLEPLTKKLNLINKYIDYKSNVLSTFSWLEPVLTPALGIGIAKSDTEQSSPQAPKHIICFTPCAKARKYFHGVLPCLVIMYHQTNLDCKSLSIFEDLVETTPWPWTSQNDISEWYSGWWWCITILSLTDQRYCPGKHTPKFRTFTVTLTLNTVKQPFLKTLQLMNMHCQTKLVAQQNQQFRTYNRNSHIWLYEPKSSYCDLDLEDGNPFFAYDALAYNDVSPGFVYKWFSDAWDIIQTNINWNF